MRRRRYETESNEALIIPERSKKLLNWSKHIVQIANR